MVKLLKRSISRRLASTLKAFIDSEFEKPRKLMLVLFLSWSAEIKSLLNRMVLSTPESRIKLKVTPLIFIGTTIKLFMASIRKHKIRLRVSMIKTKENKELEYKN